MNALNVRLPRLPDQKLDLATSEGPKQEILSTGMNLAVVAYLINNCQSFSSNLHRRSVSAMNFEVKHN
jgi:hypothetical protein